MDSEGLGKNCGTASAVIFPERNEVECECNVVDRREKFGARRKFVVIVVVEKDVI